MNVEIVLCTEHFSEIAEGRRVFNIVRYGTYGGVRVDDGLYFVDYGTGEGVLRVVRQLESVGTDYMAYGFSEKREEEIYTHMIGFSNIESMPGMWKDERDGKVVNIRWPDTLRRAEWHVNEMRRKAKAVWERRSVAN